MPFVQVPRRLNTIAQTYTKDEITAYYSLKQHLTETEAEYQERLDRHINNYVDNHWKDSKNHSSQTKKQKSNERRKKRHNMKKWLTEGSGRTRIEKEKFMMYIETAKNKIIIQNNDKIQSNTTQSVREYVKVEVNIDYKELYLESERKHVKKDKRIEELKILVVQREDELKTYKRQWGGENSSVQKTVSEERPQTYGCGEYVEIQKMIKSIDWWVIYNSHKDCFKNYIPKMLEELMDKIYNISHMAETEELDDVIVEIETLTVFNWTGEEKDILEDYYIPDYVYDARDYLIKKYNNEELIKEYIEKEYANREV